jgi:hypothetical protein
MRAHWDGRSMARWLSGGKLTVAGQRTGGKRHWGSRWAPRHHEGAWGCEGSVGRWMEEVVRGWRMLLLVGHPRWKGNKAHSQQLWSSPRGNLPLADNMHRDRLEARRGHIGGLRWDATRDGEISLPRCNPSRADDTEAHSATGRLYCSGTRRPWRAIGRHRNVVEMLHLGVRLEGAGTSSEHSGHMHRWAGAEEEWPGGLGGLGLSWSSGLGPNSFFSL